MRKNIANLSLTMVLLLVAFGGLTGRSTMAAELSVSGDEIRLDDNDPHSMHHEMLRNSRRYQFSKKHYLIPDVNLVKMSGEVISFREELSQDQPIILSFIFTSCTTICPVLTATLAQAERQLLDEAIVPRMVSVSIDPEYDTPVRLQKYASSYRAGSDWDFLTGNSKSIIAVQRAFDAYRGDKMNHLPLTFLRGPGDETWVRLEGFTTAADLVREYREIIVQ